MSQHLGSSRPGHTVVVPADRLGRWLENFSRRHGTPDLQVAEGVVSGVAPDGAGFVVRLPFGRSWQGSTTVADLIAAAAPPQAWGVLLVRKGGYAVAMLRGSAVSAVKVGRRHVQGRTKAGGQSQQRFARRRDNQARDAYAAAAEHAAQVLADLAPGSLLVTGGDRAAVAEVLSHPRLAGFTVCEPWLPVPDPRRTVLDQAVQDAAALRLEVWNEVPGEPEVPASPAH